MGFSATSTASNSRSQFSETVSEIVVEESPDGRILETPNLKVFTFTELKTATKNFNTLLGEGGFGKVYKCWLDEKTLTPSKVGFGLIVAIKKLKQESMQGFEEWQVLINSHVVYHQFQLCYHSFYLICHGRNNKGFIPRYLLNLF